MKISFWSVGKNHDLYVKDGIELFTGRIKHYFPVQWNILSLPKNSGALSEVELKRKEADLILGQLQKEDYLIALDERGQQFSSEELATILQRKSNESTKHLVFLIGGAYGLDPAVLQRAQLKWSLSKLVFPHQLVRLILSEQIYRACSIIKNEKYHHS